MRTIHKFGLVRKKLAMPEGAKILRVGLDPTGLPCIWAEVDTEKPLTERTIYTYGTGHELSAEPMEHVGSFLQGPYVWHIYEGRGAV